MSVNNFIGIYPSAVSPEYCDRVINYFEKLIAEGRILTRQSHEGASHIFKHNKVHYLENQADEQLILDNNTHMVKEFCSGVNGAYLQYQQEIGVLTSLGQHGISESVSIQKTAPGEGYHVWHCENANVMTGRRIALIILFLNDVVDGGETEFLYQHLRVQPTKGTILICPSGFTHTHRGNPPLQDNKYIMTSWIEFQE